MVVLDIFNLLVIFLVKLYNILFKDLLYLFFRDSWIKINLFKLIFLVM